MKKLTMGMGLIFVGYAANAFAALPTGVASRCDVTVPNFCGGFTFGLTGLYWRVSSPELDFGVSFPNNTSFFADSSDVSRTLQANSNYIKHDYNWAWSANVGYIFPCSGNDINLTYTHYDHDRSRESRDFGIPVFFLLSEIGAVTPFTFTYPIDEILISGSGTTSANFIVDYEIALSPDAFAPDTLTLSIDPEDITRVAARSNFENNTWDLDFGQTINVGCNVRLRWFGGLRYTRLKQTLDVVTDAVGSLVSSTVISAAGTFTVSSTITPAVVAAPGTALITFDVDTIVRDIVNQKSDFNGIGPRFGLTADYHLGGGFGLMGSLSTSLLVGNIDSRLRSRLDATPVTLPPVEGIPLDGAVAGTAIVTLPSVGTGGTLVDNLSAAIALGDFSSDFVELGFHHPDETRVVPNIDAKIGLDWTYQFCNCSHSKLTIEAGYLVSHYFDAVDRLSVIEAIAPEFRARHTVDVSFDGPYVGVQVAL